MNKSFWLGYKFYTTNKLIKSLDDNCKWVVCDGLPTERSEMKHYKKGVRITSIAEFEEYVEKGHRLFIIGWGSGMTRHIGFIQSFQYRFLKTNIINNKGLWVAEKIEGEKEDGCI